MNMLSGCVRQSGVRWSCPNVPFQESWQRIKGSAHTLCKNFPPSLIAHCPLISIWAHLVKFDDTPCNAKYNRDLNLLWIAIFFRHLIWCDCLESRVAPNYFTDQLPKMNSCWLWGRSYCILSLYPSGFEFFPFLERCHFPFCSCITFQNGRIKSVSRCSK